MTAALPSWRDSARGGMVRCALWLETEIGLGGVFTKNQLREAFSDAQIDRRMRDLRDYGWRIDTQREDASLKQEEQRYVTKGVEVWLPGRTGKIKATMTQAQRTRILQGDDFLCRSCGIAAGDLYSDDITTAQLDVARRRVRMPDGTTEVQPVTECNRCRVGSRSRVVDLDRILHDVQSLAPLELEIFAKWVEADGRKLSKLERLWGEYRSLPVESRDAVRQAALGADA